MASEPGGRANVLGIRYQRMWAVRQLLLSIAGEVAWIQFEPPEIEVPGVDVLVAHVDGEREGFQCKRENGASGKWSINDLSREGILANGRAFIQLGAKHRFSLVSSDPPGELRDMVEQSSRAANAAAFYVTLTSKRLLEAFDQFCQHLGFRTADDAERQDAFGILRGFDYHHFDKVRNERDVENLSRLWVNGEPKTIVDVLSGLVERSLGKQIYPDDVRRELKTRGFEPRDLRGDPELPAGVERLRERFERSYDTLLVARTLIRRDESRVVLERLRQRGDQRLLLIHGDAGAGKTGVLYEVIRSLDEEGVPCLPLRLDRQRPEGTTHHFGRAECHLPASPVACLRALAGDRKAVLILDQIDALRWTSAHSSDAWEVTAELIAEALECPNIYVIMSCRTFDVEDDPVLRSLKSRGDSETIVVSELTEEALNRFFKDHSFDGSQLTASQKKLLRSPHLLHLWWNLLEAHNESLTFNTATDLMRDFWKDRRSRVSEMDPSQQADNVINELVAHMDREGVLAAPARLVEDRDKSVRALISLGILVAEGNRLIFPHQSYFDYLLARNLVVEVLKGNGTVIDWLLRSSQSLFRRGQLRTLLTLLRDDDHRRYVDTVRNILANDAIRFHVKHVALQVLAHVGEPTDSEVALVKSLIASDAWRDHVYSTILFRKQQWFIALDDRDVIRQFLASGDEHAINVGISVTATNVEGLWDRAARLLEPYIHSDDAWRRRVSNVTYHIPPEHLSKHLFAAFAESIRNGEVSPWFVKWKTLAQSNPVRCQILYAAWIKRELRRLIRGEDVTSRTRRDDPDDRPDDFAPILNASRFAHATAWRVLFPKFWRAIAVRSRHRRERASGEFNADFWRWDRDVQPLLQNVEHVLVAAGGRNALFRPRWLWRETKKLRHSHSKHIIRVLTLSFARFTDQEFADRALRWLTSARRRFHSGPAGTRACLPARELIERCASKCSDEVFMRVEKSIFDFRSSYEKRSFKFQAESLISGHIYANKYGLGQYLLLSALPPERMSANASSRLREWRRKFGPIEPHLQLPSRGKGGWVGSTIPSSALAHISDDNWIRLLTTNWRARRPNRVQLSPDTVGDLTPETIARDLKVAASREPLRFARLALRIPPNYSGYLAEILDALANLKPPEGLKDTESEMWEQAPLDVVEIVIRHMGYPEGRSLAMSYARLITARSAEPWPDAAIGLIVQLAMKHPDPAVDEMSVHSSTDKEGMQPDVASSSLNCVRGCAAAAVAGLLYHHPSKQSLLRQSMESLLADGSPAVRAAAIELCLPLINIDRNLAAHSFVRACNHSDDRVLSSHHVNRVIGYLIRSQFSTIAPVITRMANSGVQKVSTAGAAWATFAWLDLDQLSDVVDACTTGSAAQRIGVAEVLVDHLAELGWKSLAVDRLKSMFDDADANVRHKATSIFGNENSFKSTHAVDICQAFVRSTAFAQDPTWLLTGLEEHTATLLPYAQVILDACDRVAGPLAEKARDVSHVVAGDIGTVATLLLRLYQQAADHSSLRNQCLDRWDKLLAARIGYDLLKALDE